ncbi:hypothetical protein D3C76_919500 [compost metagenome]
MRIGVVPCTDGVIHVIEYSREVAPAGVRQGGSDVGYRCIDIVFKRLPLSQHRLQVRLDGHRLSSHIGKIVRQHMQCCDIGSDVLDRGKGRVDRRLVSLDLLGVQRDVGTCNSNRRAEHEPYERTNGP